MDYHSHLFTDNSLLVYRGSSLIGVLPANVQGDSVISHQGLSYGGLVLSEKVKFEDVLVAFREILFYLSSEGIKNLEIKLLPKIYHRLPADEIDYLLFLTEAKQTRVDVSSSIDLRQPYKIRSNRMEGVKKARRHELQIKEDAGFKLFWEQILIPNLKKQHNTSPVHSVKEINSLANSFPKNIKQFNVYHGETLVAGTTIFETQHLVHIQYISANADKQQLGSLDFLFHFLITERYSDKDYFDFGISNINTGKNVNRGLLFWKECFGARSISHQFYTISTTNYSHLDSVFI